jgi:two-component system response regulator NreC
MRLPVRVALIDDHELFRAGMRGLLETYPDFQVVGEAADARSGYQMVAETTPDLVLLDVRLPGTSGIAAARELRRLNPELRVAMLSATSDADFVAGALQAGARGYLLKSLPVRTCVEGLRAVARGETFLAPGIPEAALEQHGRLQRGGERESLFQLLSRREQEVFHLLVQGRPNAAVAEELCISIKTVETHREHILKKLGLHSIVDLVRFAVRHQLIAE